MEKWTQHFLGLGMQVAEFVIGEKWTQNGLDLLEMSRSNLVAISTHGEANRQCWTWLSPFKTKHRLDNMITRQTDADHGKVRVDYRTPVGVSGFRDHRPLVARVCTRARWKQQQPEEEIPKTEAMGQITCGKGVQVGVCEKGQDASSTEEPMFLLCNMTTPDIEAEIVKRALVPQRKARSLRLPAEILELVEQKQRYLQRWRGARRLCEREQLSRLTKSQTAAVNGAERAPRGENWKILLMNWKSEINARNGEEISSSPGTAQNHSTPERWIFNVGSRWRDCSAQRCIGHCFWSRAAFVGSGTSVSPSQEMDTS